MASVVWEPPRMGCWVPAAAEGDRGGAVATEGGNTGTNVSSSSLKNGGMPWPVILVPRMKSGCTALGCPTKSKVGVIMVGPLPKEGPAVIVDGEET